MKKVYVLIGSEDGVIGVFTTAKKAWIKANKYLDLGGSRLISYNTFLKNKGNIERDAAKGIKVDINTQVWELNHMW